MSEDNVWTNELATDLTILLGIHGCTQGPWINSIFEATIERERPYT